MLRIYALITAMVFFLSSGSVFGETELTANEQRVIKARLTPIPAQADNPNNPITPEKVALGKRLFFETALSNPKANNGNLVSCNTCHDLTAYGVDGIDRSIGIMKFKVPVNAPTVYNSALHFRQFWDGRAKDVEEQALGPITATKEMGFTNSKADQAQVLNQLKKADPKYVQQFAKAFPEDGANAFNFNNIGQAIGAFERTLLTPSRFDQYLKGKTSALTAPEQTGLKLFVSLGNGGCAFCHNGAAIGGGGFRILGERHQQPKAGDQLAQKVFKDIPSPLKVPSLRNIEKTGPYFHNGSVTSLDEAITFMAYYQLSVTVTAAQVEDLRVFLKSLTGDLPEEFAVSHKSLPSYSVPTRNKIPID